MNYYEQLLEFYGDYDFNYFVHISIKHKILYFEIPKTGCTTVKNIIARLELGRFSFMLDDADDSAIHLAPYSSTTLRPFNLTPEQFNWMIKSNEYYKFAIVRDPLERLVSAYYDKIIRNSNESKELVYHLINKGVEADAYLVDDNPLPIDYFIMGLMSMEAESGSVNSHFRSQQKLLPVHIIKFDEIYEFSNIESAMKNLMARAGQSTNLRVYGSHSVKGGEKIALLSEKDKRLMANYVSDDYRFFKELLNFNYFSNC